MPQTPIQVVVLRVPADRASREFVKVLRAAFEGASYRDGGYLKTGLDTGIPLLVPHDPTQRSFTAARRKALLAAAKITVVVEIQPRPRNAALSRITRTMTTGRRSVTRISATTPKPIAKGALQVHRPAPDEVEKELSPTALALRTLDRVRKQLDQCRPARRRRRLALFLSHAKLDGIPVALSLVNLIRRFQPDRSSQATRGRAVFYDAISIEPGDRWADKLREFAGSCVMIALRTEEYENRYWCRQEYLAAEENGMPIVVVDLRTGQDHLPERLPLGRATTVRVHDGNLVRVIFGAIVAHVRTLRLECMVAQMLGDDAYFEVLPQHPTEVSLFGARERLECARRQAGHAQRPCWIVYLEPRGTPHFARAADALLDSDRTGIRLLTVDELTAAIAEGAAG